MNGKQLKNSILQWAIQGKLVPQDPNDEPASVLLDRIREERKRLVKEGKIKKDKNESIIYRGDDNSHYEKFADGTVRCIDDEIPFEIPQGWGWARLGSLVSNSTGLSYQKDLLDEKTDSMIRVLRGGNIEDGTWQKKDDDVFIASKYVKPDLLLRKGTFITPAVTSLEQMGKTGLVNSDEESTVVGGFVLMLNPYLKDEALISFLHIVFQTGYYKNYCKQITKKSGQAFYNLSRPLLMECLIPIPSHQNMHSIIAECATLRPYIETYGKQQGQLDLLNKLLKTKLKKSILQEAIQGKLVSQDPTDEPASLLPDRIREEKQKLLKEGKIKKKDIVDSIIFKGEDNKYYEKVGGKVLDISEEIPFDLPETWAWSRFSVIAHYRIGKTPTRGETAYWESGTIPWVSISDMKEYGRVSHTKECVTSKATPLLGQISRSGTLLMSFKLTVGRTAILDIDAYHNEAIISIWPFVDADAAKPYLFYTLPLLANLGDSKDAIKGKTLNTNSINNLLIPIPPSNEQVAIVMRIKELYARL